MSRKGTTTWRDAFGVNAKDFYAMADLDIARKIGGGLWFGGFLVAAVLLPLAPPDNTSLGDAGWVVAAAIIVGTLAYAARLLRWGADVGPDELLGMNYVAVVLISILVWLDGAHAPYTELLLLPVIYTAVLHPPLRTIAFLVFVGAALALPLLYAEDQSLADQLARFLIWGGLATAGAFFIAYVRMQRAGLREAGEQARSEARADPLTGLGNRRAFNEALDAATLRTGRTNTALSVILADVDSFKEINDGFGLPAGDRCLREVAAVLRKTVRQPDALFRWGGDEFAVVADVDRAGAERLGTRLGAAVSAACRRPDGQPVRLHIGTAELDHDGADAADLLMTASRELKPSGE